MDVSALILLVEILDAGNLSLAAKKLKITRANVSYHLMQLEKSVGVQLVRRTTRRLWIWVAADGLLKKLSRVFGDRLVAADRHAQFGIGKIDARCDGA